MEFAKKLSRLLKDHRYSQEMLARELDVSQNQISKWCRGVTIPDLKESAAIARIFGVSMEWLADDAADYPAPVELTERERDVLKAVRALGDPDEALRRIVRSTGQPWLPGSVRTLPEPPPRYPKRPEPTYGPNDAVQGTVGRKEDDDPKPKRKRG
jgi:transcriptional regulator with XRE-family HTH domain